MVQKIKESWKAIVALLIPIAFGAATEIVEALGDWVATQNGWAVGLATGALTAAGVWLKRNAPQT